MGDPLSTLSLFTGIGGLDLGVSRAVRTRAVGYVERDAYAAAVLMARMEDARMEPAPLFCGEVQSVDWSPFRDRVDLVIGGFPCQDVSVANHAGAGIGGARSGLWSEIVRAVCETGAGLVFVENVSILRTRGLDTVLADLCRIGFDAEWGVFRASDAGAPHRRERMFILAGRRADVVDDTDGRRCEIERIALRAGIIRPCGDQPDRRGNGWSGWPPAPNDADGWREWIAAGGPEPAVRRGADGVAYRVDRLRCLGNAVVPQQAALAFLVLAERMRKEPKP